MYSALLLVRAEEALLGKQEGCVLFLLCTPTLGLDPLVSPWDDDMVCSLVSQAQLHPLLPPPPPPFMVARATVSACLPLLTPSLLL